MQGVLVSVFLILTLASGVVGAETFAFYSDEGRLIRHSLQDGAVVDLGPLDDVVVRLAFSPDGQLFAVSNRDDVVILQIVDTSDASSQDVAELPGLASRIRGMTFDDTGLLWMTQAGPPVSGSVTELISYDILTGQRSVVELSQPVDLLASRNQTLYGTRRGTTLSVIHPLTGLVEDLFAGNAILIAAFGAAFSPDGLLWLAKQGAVDPPFGDGRLHAVDIPSQQVVERFPLPEFVSGLAIAEVGPPEGLFLREGRFRVQVSWQDFEGNTGVGQPVPVDSPESGMFYFFSLENWEVLVKVIDGCAFNQHYWFFSAATTNVEYTLEVTDLESGQRVEYFNPLGERAPAITDTTAFSSCP